MKILLVGSGGREHAIAWKISQSPLLSELYIAPGNGGTANIGKNIPIEENDIDGLVSFAKKQTIDLVIVGPEAPLSEGLVDQLNSSNILSFGPTQKAAQLESSMSFAKSLMMDNEVPTARYEISHNKDSASESIKRFSFPVVIKADGLAAGKGVYICQTLEESEDALNEIFTQNKFGESGNTVVIEEFLVGREISVFAFTDGDKIAPLVTACDYKRIGDNDQGPNTGGMGAYTPTPIWNQHLESEIQTKVVDKVIQVMKKNYGGYVGVLFVGLIITDKGPKVLEFNCRLGDPETQVILPLLKSDLLDLAYKCSKGELNPEEVIWSDEACVTVVLTSGGYPNNYDVGYDILGTDTITDESILFHAGTRQSDDGTLLTNGGRVLSVSTVAQSVSEAREASYRNIAGVTFEKKYHRTDIGRDVESQTQQKTQDSNK